MPIYEYECPKCGHRQEELSSVADRFDGPDCNECIKSGRASMTKLATSTPAWPVMNPAVPVKKPHNM